MKIAGRRHGIRHLSRHPLTVPRGQSEWPRHRSSHVTAPWRIGELISSCRSTWQIFWPKISNTNRTSVYDGLHVLPWIMLHPIHEVFLYKSYMPKIINNDGWLKYKLLSPRYPAQAPPLLYPGVYALYAKHTEMGHYMYLGSRSLPPPTKT